MFWMVSQGSLRSTSLSLSLSLSLCVLTETVNELCTHIVTHGFSRTYSLSFFLSLSLSVLRDSKIGLYARVLSLSPCLRSHELDVLRCSSPHARTAGSDSQKFDFLAWDTLRPSHLYIYRHQKGDKTESKTTIFFCHESCDLKQLAKILCLLRMFPAISHASFLSGETGGLLPTYQIVAKEGLQNLQSKCCREKQPNLGGESWVG